MNERMKSEESFRLVILDDDPTGIQTVHGCLLITQWDEATVRMALQHEQPFFYMLTNTRAMTREEAALLGWCARPWKRYWK